MKTGTPTVQCAAGMPAQWTSLPRQVPVGLLAGALALAAGDTRTFETDAVGRPPAGFTFHVVRHASAARWLIERGPDNGFLAHAAEGTGQAGFAIAVLDGAPHGRISLSARIRLMGGARSGGLVWKVQDPDNYYLARLDLDRQDLGLYRVVNGNRVRIEGEDDLELDRNAWHTLKIVQESENIRVYLGGIRVLRARDRTFESRGSVGLWCTTDSTAHFDDLRLDQGADGADPRRGR